MAKHNAPTESTVTAAGHKIEEFADDLGKLLGSAKARAEGWIGQRKSIAEHLSGIRDTANGLLAQLGMRDGGRTATKAKRGRARRVSSARVQTAASSDTTASATGRKPRTMSAEARARISAAQKKRWARLRKSQNKG